MTQLTGTGFALVIDVCPYFELNVDLEHHHSQHRPAQSAKFHMMLSHNVNIIMCGGGRSSHVVRRRWQVRPIPSILFATTAKQPLAGRFPVTSTCLGDFILSSRSISAPL